MPRRRFWLPGLNGYDVARVFKSHRTLSGIPLIALSAYGDPEKTHAAGFDHHLVKPTKVSALTDLSAQVCAQPGRGC